MRQLVCYKHKAHILVSDINKDNPLTFKEAMQDPDIDKWQDVMNQEMESIYSNSVWELIDLPDNVKAIGCK